VSFIPRPRPRLIVVLSCGGFTTDHVKHHGRGDAWLCLETRRTQHYPSPGKEERRPWRSKHHAARRDTAELTKPQCRDPRLVPAAWHETRRRPCSDATVREQSTRTRGKNPGARKSLDSSCTWLHTCKNGIGATILRGCLGL
jgi:hypothetical protein